MIKIFITDIIRPVEHPGGFQPFLAHADVSVKENEEKKIRGSDCLIASPGYSSSFLVRHTHKDRKYYRFLSMEECKTFFLRSHFSDPFYEYCISSNNSRGDY